MNPQQQGQQQQQAPGGYPPPQHQQQQQQQFQSYQQQQSQMQQQQPPLASPPRGHEPMQRGGAMPPQMLQQQQQQQPMMIPQQQFMPSQQQQPMPQVHMQYPPPQQQMMQQQQHPTGMYQGQPVSGQADAATNSTAATESEDSLSSKMQSPAALGNRLKGIFHKDKSAHAGPNLGFTPTAAMAQRHEDALVSSKRPLYQFQVTKLRNWRTGYVRLLCLYDDHAATMDPDTHNPTNTWKYSSLVDFGSIADKDQIVLQFDKDKLKLQCHNVSKSRVLTALLECQDNHDSTGNSTSSLILCNRWTRHGLQSPSAVRVTPYGLIEVHPATQKVLQVYRYVDIVAISFSTDDPNGMILHFQSKATTRLFSLTSAGRSEVVTAMRQAYQRLGLELRMTDSTTTQQWKQMRRDQLHAHRQMTVATEYAVTKPTKRHNTAMVGTTAAGGSWPGGVVARTLCLTGQGLILEKDPSDGSVVSCRSLKDLYAIVRPAAAGDQILLEYFGGGQVRTYYSPSRDSLIVSLLDAASTLGRNPKVHITDTPSSGYNLASFAKTPPAASPEKTGGLFQPISIPLHCLKRVHSVATAAFSYFNSTTESSTDEGQPLNPIEECRNVMELCREFNASVLPTAEGLPTGEKDRYVLGAIGALWGLAAELLECQKDRHLAELSAAPMFQTLHRLSKTPSGYKHSIELATFIDCLPLLWTIDDPFCQFWAFRTLTVILSGLHRNNRDKELEYVNKSVIFKAGGPRLIHGLVGSLLNEKASDMIRMVMSDILQSVLCSFADTTGPEHFHALIQALGENYQGLLGTLYQQTPFVIENSALLLHLLSTHAPIVAAAIREAVLSSAILLHHFHAAIFSPLEGQRFLSRFLCSLWLAGPLECDEKKWLRRTVPRGFMNYLKMPALSRAEEEQLDALERDAVEENIPEGGGAGDANDTVPATSISSYSGAAGTNTSRLRSRIALARVIASSQDQKESNYTPENFRIFFHVLTQNHNLPDLIWNQQTRRELRIGLESEIQYIQRETEARGINQIAWNHQQFGIDYPSLENELRVGSVYMRLWLQAGEGFIKSWDEPLRLFELLFRRFLCEMDRNTKVTVMCIRCLERLYAIHGNTIGAFPDVMILIRSMASTRSIETQHRLLGLLATILGVQKDDNGDESTINVQENAEQLLNTESIEQLCQFVAWGHTNGVQVGNLMTTVLGNAHSGRAMLTDGTDMSAAGQNSLNSDHTRKPERGADAGCPAVWFVASTGRVPPPPETVRGPFRVSQLKEMMEHGDLSPFTLVSSAHVDSYDDDVGEGDNTDVKEAQIDTGKWKRLDQVWQLRWQLCTDGNSTGLFTPSEVALRAIRSLTRLVDLHKSLDYRGLPYYPIPIAKRIMCGLSREPITGSNGGQSSNDQNESFLSILAQSVLCNDPQVVDKAAELLLKLVNHNEEAMSKFYLTGIYFFISCYTGSNFKTMTQLLSESHLKQHFRSGFAAAADTNELPLKERSILGALLPEGLLNILLNYAVERFSEVFVGNFDTPEVIWNFEMRKHLIEMVRQHLGDFPKRLWQNTTTKYEYCPIPGVAYKRLEKEVFCHNYYLNNLCDEKRFPDWPIAEPVEVFRACLEEFKKQINRDETEVEEAVAQATKVLELKAGDGSKELRKAYRSMARIYHPDKNPAGREMFEAIQAAYELLLPLVESGQSIQAPSGSTDRDKLSVETAEAGSTTAEGFAGSLLQMRALHLLIRTQALICRRFEKEMSKYKYPAYALLFMCLKIPTSSSTAREQDDVDAIFASSLMTAYRAEFVRDTVELVFRSCLVSPLNAEELVHTSGVVFLDDLLDFYVNAAHRMDDSQNVGQAAAADEIISEILANIIHTISGVAYYESGRAAIAALGQKSRFCINWRRCLDSQFLGQRIKIVGDNLIKRYALEGVAHMAKHEDLQTHLIGCGTVWPLLRFLLGFDPTLDEGGMSKDSLEDDVGVSQAASNCHARLAVRGLGMLCGAVQDKNLRSPKNQELQKALDILLTSPIALLLRNKRTSEILRILNANVETPSRIWNVGMRSDLIKFLQKVEGKRPENSIQTIEDELSHTSSFEYGALKTELRIGGVYIRLFNQIGLDNGNMREIQRPSEFAKQLVAFVAKCINSSQGLSESWLALDGLHEEIDLAGVPGTLSQMSINDRRFVMAMTALKILVQSDGLIDDVICSNEVVMTPVLISLLELPQESEAFDIGCDILATLSPKKHFADSVALQGALWRLLWVLERPDAQEHTDGQDSSHTANGEMLRKQRGWMLLEALSSSASIANRIIESSAWIELLGILVGYVGFTKVFIARVGAAKTLSRLLWDPKTGGSIAPLLQRFLPATLIVMLKEEGAEKMLGLFDGESDTPELIWDSSMRTELRKAIAQVLDGCMEDRKTASVGNEAFTLDPSTRVKYQKLEKELFVGGVYVSRFLKEPTYNIRDPTRFLEMLMQRWSHELQLCTQHNRPTVGEGESTALTIGGEDSLQSVTNASVYICKVRPNLCEKLSNWGYMSRCLSSLEDVLTKELYGTPLLSIMRILHVSVNSRLNVESIILSGKNNASHGIIPMTLRSIESNGLHKDVAFMLEMMKKLFSDALGDIKRANNAHADFKHRAYAMAPSPAPGEGPVSRNRVTRGNPLDDPLATPAVPSELMRSQLAQNNFVAQPTLQTNMHWSPNPNPPSTMNMNAYAHSAQPSYMPQPLQSFDRQSSGMSGSSQQLSQASDYRSDYSNQLHYQQPYNGQSAAHLTSGRFNHQQQSFHQMPFQPGQNQQYSQSTHQPTQGIAWNAQQMQSRGMQGQVYGHPDSGYLQQQQHNVPVANPLTTSVPGQQVQQRQQPQFQEQQQTRQQQHQIQEQQQMSRQGHQQRQQTGYSQYQPQQQFQQPRPQLQAPAPVMQGFGPNQTQNVGHQQQQGTHSMQQTQSLQVARQTPQHSVLPNSSMRQQQNHYGQQKAASVNGQSMVSPGLPAPHGAFGGSLGNSNASGFGLPTQASALSSSQLIQDSSGTPQQHSMQNSAVMGNGPQTPLAGVQVETVPNTQQQTAEGTGVDARAPMNPKEEAELKAKTSPPAPGAADGRVALLECAILCNLADFIIDKVLENAELRNVKDPAAAKVHAVELLKLLTQDPGYGMKFGLILDKNPMWKKYKAQDHSLFITGPEQRADYFLTDGKNGETQKLLTQE